MIESQHLLEAFKIAPAIVALIVVIWLLYRLLKAKDATIQQLVEISRGDSERYGKLITLLEILVQQKKGE